MSGHPPRRRGRPGTGDNGTVSTSTDHGPGRTFSGLLRALVPAVVVLLLIVWWQRGEAAPVPTADAASQAAYAQRISPVPLPAPAGLPAEWRATSAHVDAPSGEKRSPVTLTIGYLTGADRYAEVAIGDRTESALLRATAPAAVEEGTVAVGPATWKRYTSDRDEPLLLATVGKAAVLVTGDAPVEDLVRLAGSVR